MGNKAIIILGLLVTFSLPLLFIEKKQVVDESFTKKEFWQSTNLSLTHVRELINNDFCNKEAKNFIACISGVNNSLSKIGKKLSFDGSIIEGLYTSDKEELMPWFSFRKSVNINFDTLINDLDKLYDNDSKPYHYAMLINGFMSVHYDPHTYILSFLEYDNRYQGSPMTKRHRIAKSIKSGNYYFISLTSDSPLYEQGVRVRDIIKEVNGHEVKDISNTEFESVLKASDRIKMKILRGDKEINLVLKSNNLIKSPNVSSKTINSNSALIKVDLFNENTCELFTNEVKKLNQQGMKNLVLDLRDNGGGSVEAVMCMTGLFFDSPKLIFNLIRIQDKTQEAYFSFDKNQNLFSGKLYILINSNSGSASEIFAGALKDLKRATLVGQTSFGKGSVQDCQYWNKNKLILQCKTNYVYQLPSGFYTQNEGVVPDILVKIDNSISPRESDMFFPITVKQSVSQNKSLMIVDKLDANDEDIELSVVTDLINNDDLKLGEVKRE